MEAFFFFVSKCDPIFHNAQCFCLDIDGKVAIFNLKDPESTWRIYRSNFHVNRIGFNGLK